MAHRNCHITSGLGLLIFVSLTLTVTGISCFQEGVRSFLLPGTCSFTCWPDVLHQY